MIIDDDEAGPFGNRNWIIPVLMIAFAFVAGFVGLLNTPEESRATLTPEQLQAEAQREADDRGGFAVQADSPPVTRALTNED